MDFQRMVEEQLRKAREDGKFDNLRGHGQPLRLDENPFEDPAWQMANDMLKKNGFRPGWLEEDITLPWASLESKGRPMEGGPNRATL